MNLVVNLTQWNNLAPWKRKALRHVMGDLLLGEPATGTISGIPVAVFSDERFDAYKAYALGVVIMGIAGLPDEPPGNTTPQDAFVAAGVPTNAARFFATLPDSWVPDEA